MSSPPIGAGIHEAPNRTRYAMNNALIAIGGAMPALRPRALKAARTIGRVEVDHGDTNAERRTRRPMIDKMASHRAARRKRVAGARGRRLSTTRSAGARPVTLGPRVERSHRGRAQARAENRRAQALPSHPQRTQDRHAPGHHPHGDGAQDARSLTAALYRPGWTTRRPCARAASARRAS